MVAFCSIQGDVLDSADCCAKAFSRKAMFSSKGVCYTSKFKAVAHSPTEFDGLEIWVIAKRAKFQEEGTFNSRDLKNFNSVK